MVRFGTVCTLLAVLGAFGCKRPAATDPESDEAAERRRAVLNDLATMVVVPAYEDFAANARTLRVAVDAWAASADLADRTAAQAAWHEAMLSWEVAELFQFGPAAAMGVSAGGQDLRDQIYSWPTVNPCRVDQEIVEQAYEDAEAFRSEAVNVRGLDALEYLLHHDETENQCDATRSINADGSWAALNEADLDGRRARYAKTLTGLLVSDADALVAAWDDGFTAELGTAGARSETYPTTQEALNAVSDAMFYVDTDLKDMKLAEPAGILNCATATCPDAREFLWVEANFAAMGANLDAFGRLFRGRSGLGFDDLLVDAGQDQLATDIGNRLDEASSAVASMPTSLTKALADDPRQVVAIHVEVKELIDLLKTQFVGVLDLELPDRADGDND